MVNTANPIADKASPTRTLVSPWRVCAIRQRAADVSPVTFINIDAYVFFQLVSIGTWALIGTRHIDAHSIRSACVRSKGTFIVVDALARFARVSFITRALKSPRGVDTCCAIPTIRQTRLALI